MEITMTAKIKINPTSEQMNLLRTTLDAYRSGCNFVSALVFDTKQLAQAKPHKMTYESLRSLFSLRSLNRTSVR